MFLSAGNGPSYILILSIRSPSINFQRKRDCEGGTDDFIAKS